MTTQEILDDIIFDIYSLHGLELIDGKYFPTATYKDYQCIPEFYERHHTVAELGFYQGENMLNALFYRFTLSNYQIAEITSAAEYATPAMVQSKVLGQKVLNQYERRCFDYYYNIGYMKGQCVISEQLYILAQMGDYKAIDKFLSVRGAFSPIDQDSGPSIQITLTQDENNIIDINSSSINGITNLIQFPK